MIIAGRNAVKEALSGGAKLETLYVAKGAHDTGKLVALAKENGVEIRFEDRNVLDKLAGGVKHQGVAAKASEYVYADLDDLVSLGAAEGAAPFLLLLDGIEDPHNLGSILRVAECSGVDGVVIPVRRSASVNATVIKVSAGAALHVKVARVGNINGAVRKLKDAFFNVYCADMDGQPMYSADMRGATALVIGGEGGGVGALTAKLCDKKLSIPQFGKVNSLNASVACGIVCYEAVRQRGGAL